MISKEDLERYFYYDPTSPSGLRWKVDRFAGAYRTRKVASAGDVAGCINKRSTTKYKRQYWSVSLNNSRLHVHRVIWALHYGALEKGLVIDHKDGNSLNNVLDNLRVVTQAVNQRNQKLHSRNLTGVSGVWLNESRNRYETGVYLQDGRYIRKVFAITKYGLQAFEMACAWRKQMLDKRNAEGAGYSERHGT